MGTADSFVHLHVASGYSLRHGTAMPSVLVQRAADLGMDILALTDRDGLYGAVRFVDACTAAGIRPVLGADLAVDLGADPAAGSAMDPAPRPGPARPHPTTTAVPGPAPAGPASAAPAPTRPGAARLTPDRAAVDAARRPRVTLLARGRDGWAALCRAVSSAHATPAPLRGVPALRPGALAELPCAASLVVLLGPDSDVGRAVAAGRPDRAAAALRRWREAAGPAEVVVEVVHQLAPPGHPASGATAGRLLRLAREAGVRAVLGNAVRYPVPEDAPVADVLDAARRLVPLELRHRDRVNAEGYLKSGAQMAVLADELCGGDRAEAARLLGDTRRLAESLALDPIADLGFGSIHTPEPSVLGSSRHRVAADLRARCEAGLWRYPGARRAEAETRLEEELAVIGRLGYSSYFLTVAEVVRLTREAGIRCAARGSGAGSLVNHLLGISGVEPLRYGLLMERFLSTARPTLPDIDLDVESARRTEVYDLILERFGAERTLCVAMPETYRVRHAVRDAGAALGLPPQEIDAVAKAFPHIRARDARAALRDLPELRGSRLDEGVFAVLFDLVEKLDGLPRHIALHPCGVLLSDRRLLDRTAVETSAQDYPMSQFDKEDVERMGLVKLDVLGVRMQSAMAHALAEAERCGDGPVDLDAVPLDDPETFELIRSTRTLGCFQIESPGQRELIGKFAPASFEDLIIDISLFRPGPVKSDMITPFLNARHGWSTPAYLHDDLRPILGETEGVVVFHEQVIRILAAFTGTDAERGDRARRMLGTTEGQQAVRDWFCVAADARGYRRPVVEKIWEVLKSFASFGFCKAHAAAFALPTYQSAWLKAHHPAAFYAGLLTHDPGMYPKRLLLDDARLFGVPVLPPCVNASQPHYTAEPAETAEAAEPGGSAPHGLRIGLADVKGITDAELTRILAARAEAPFRSLADLRRRARPSRPTLENLVLAGALDAVAHGRNRRELLLQAATDPRPATGPRSPGPDQLELADALPDPDAPAPGAHAPASAPGHSAAEHGGGLPAPTPAELVRGEVESLGLDHSAHLLTPYQDLLDALGTVRSRDLLHTRNRSEVLVAGVKVATQTPPVRSGVRVVFATLDDATGPVDFALFEDAQQHYAATVFHSWLLLARGVVRRTGPRGVSLTATAVWELTALHERWQAEGGGAAGLAAVRALLATAPRDTAATDGGEDAAGPDEARTRRVLVHPSGFRMSPYADLRPPGVPAADAPRKLWHTSPGSPG